MPEGGRCHGKTSLTAFFFSDNTSEQNTAKRMCFECPVQFECLEYALHNNEKFGIFGGLLPSERRSILKNRDRQPSPR